MSCLSRGWLCSERSFLIDGHTGSPPSAFARGFGVTRRGDDDKEGAEMTMVLLACSFLLGFGASIAVHFFLNKDLFTH
jgi:hypothetical protein